MWLVIMKERTYFAFYQVFGVNLTCYFILWDQNNPRVNLSVKMSDSADTES